MKFKSKAALLTLFFCLALAAGWAVWPALSVVSAASKGEAGPVTLDELAEVLPEIKYGLESVRLRKNPGLLNNNAIADTTLPRLALLDATLSGGKFSNVYMPELHAKNLVLKNFRFTDCLIAKAVFENVRFENCVFEGTFINSSSFSQCEFNDCTFTHKDSASNQPDFDKNSFSRVSINRARFKNSFTLSNSEGQLTVREIKEAQATPNVGRFLFHGLGLQLRVEKSSIGDIDFLQTWRDSRVEIVDSEFKGSKFWMGKSELKFSKCSFDKNVSLDVEGSVTMNNCSAPDGVKTGYSTVLKVSGGNVKTS